MRKSFFSLCIILLLAISCQKKEPVPPTADFSISVQNVTYTDRAPLKVRLRANTTSGATYSWFTTGENSLTTGEAIDVVFRTASTHTMRLSVTKDGLTSTVEKTIVVKPAFTNAKIKKITLGSYPATNSSGFSWDLLPFPSTADLYHQVAAGNVLLGSGSNIDNASPNAPNVWNYQTPLFISNTYMNTPISINFWDDDTPFNQTVSEFIGGISITSMSNFIVDNTSPLIRYPTIITGGTTTPVIVELEWQ